MKLASLRSFRHTGRPFFNGVRLPLNDHIINVHRYMFPDILFESIIISFLTGDYFDFDVKDLVTRYTNDVIASCTFGLKMDSQNVAESKFYEMGKAASELTYIQILKFVGFQSFPSLMKVSSSSVLWETSSDSLSKKIFLICQHVKELSHEGIAL